MRSHCKLNTFKNGENANKNISGAKKTSEILNNNIECLYTGKRKMLHNP